MPPIRSDITLTRRTIVLTVGLPASGKTTWACQQVDNDPTGLLTRANHDDLRAMLRKPYPTDEDTVTAVQRAAVTALLHRGHSVIIDDTNLDPAHERDWRALAHSIATGPPVHVLSVTEFLWFPIQVCINRDSARGHQVGAEAITKLYQRWNEQLPQLTYAATMINHPTRPQAQLPNLVIAHH